MFVLAEKSKQTVDNFDFIYNTHLWWNLTLHKNQELEPKDQYFVKIPTKVIGMVNKHNVESATANNAIKIFLAVLIPEMNFKIQYL